MAYWEAPYLEDSTITGSMKVSPKSTTSYNALVVYGKDTFRLKGTAVVCRRYDRDTIYELACRDTLNKWYDSKKNSLFTHLYVDTVTDGYVTYRDTQHTVHGCDSIITLQLMVVDGCENVYSDTVCPLEAPYPILDTTFLPGTVSGIYARPGRKYAGGLWIDTVSYIDLTIHRPPEVVINGPVDTCPGVSVQTLGATVTGGDAPYAYTWSLEGTGVTLTGEDTPTPTAGMPAVCGASYTVKLDVTDGFGCKADQAVRDVTVKSAVPVIGTTAASGDLGCNPGTITAPSFTVRDNCAGDLALPMDSVTVEGPTLTGCVYTQRWTAHYTDGCGQKAVDKVVEYTWTDNPQPVIVTTLTDKTIGCASAVVAPTPADFTVTDACDAMASVTVTGGTETVVGTEHSRTWTATYQNTCGLDALPVEITYKWVDAPSITVTCGDSLVDTLSFGDCAMKIDPEKLVKPSVSITPSGSPYGVTNDFPTDSLFSEGEHFVEWTVLDSVCGYTATCSQKVVVVFPKCPDAEDCEHNIYHGVRIGCDCWTERNLESTQYSDCAGITGVYSYASDMYPDTVENVGRFGRLYSYEAAVRDSSDNGHGHIQGVCPAGWYLPTPEKYLELDAYGSDALKSPLYWLGGGGSNSTGFTSLPGGYYDGATGRYENLMGEAYYWSTQVSGGTVSPYSCVVTHSCNEVQTILPREGLGYSVRCIKEKE